MKAFSSHPWTTALAYRQVTGSPLLRQSTIRTLACDNRRTHKSCSSDSSTRLEATDEQIVQELNSAHIWLPDQQQAEEFGLDDVEAHLAFRQGAQALDVSKKGNRRNKRGASSSGVVSTLADVDPESGDLPIWVEKLREEGFNVLGREGELFLQRGIVPPQQQYTSTSGSEVSACQNSKKARSAGGQETSIEVFGPAQQFAHEKLEEAAAAIPDSNLAVGREFNPLTWQQQKQVVHPWRAKLHKDAWYTAEAGGSGIKIVSSPETGQDRAMQDHSTGIQRMNVSKHLLGFSCPNRLLTYVETCFLSWSSNGCWLLHQTRLGAVSAPTPAEAAAALKGVALAAKRAGYNLVQNQSLARDRRVLGLVECLRLTPPRSPPQQPASISKRLWSIAKEYWLQAGAAGAAAQQELLTASRMAAAEAPPAAAAEGSVVPVEPGVMLSADPSGAVPSLGPLLAQLQSSGLTLTRQQLAAAQALIRSRQEEQLRKQAFVHAIWAMSAIGGPLFFQPEMDAICQVAAVGRWQLGSSEVSDVLWALANARHWSKLLPQLEAALVSAGGVPSCTAPELVSVLWSYATLAYRPRQLLEQLSIQGWAVKPAIDTPPTQRTRKATAMTASRTGSNQHMKQQQQQEGICRLDELSGGQLTSLAWSLACIQEVTSGLFKQVWVEVCRRGMDLSGDNRQLARVQQAALALQLEGGVASHHLLSDQGAAQLLEEAARVFKAQSGALQAKVHSSYQRSIASILAQQRVMHVLEDCSTGYSVDISIPSLRVALEADGPSHMSRNSVAGRGRVQLGATAMKRRHLQGLGWAVVNIAYEDWDRLGVEEQRASFLQQQIRVARAELAAVKYM